METDEYFTIIKSLQIDMRVSSQVELSPRQGYRLLELLKTEGYKFPDHMIEIEELDRKGLDNIYVAILNNEYIIALPTPLKQVPLLSLAPFIQQWVHRKPISTKNIIKNEA